MSNKYMLKWYSFKKASQYLLFLGLVAGFTQVEELRAAPTVQSVAQQTITVKGTILDNNGEPIIGANVMVNGGTKGTITDIDGNFTLVVPVGTKLKVSFVGYETQLVTVKGSKLQVVLQDDSNLLEEVQIVAYGAQKKVTVTGAVSGINGTELLKSPVSSVSNVLAGQMTGITTVQYSGEPGQDAAKIFVRGQGTWNNSDPLIQVDGVERSFSEIDPNEIESITVLKDASATAVFGVRGANGVVLITTKRGQEGRAKISFSTSASVLMPTTMAERANAYQYADFYNRMKKNDDPNAGLAFSEEIMQKFKDHSDPIRFPDVDWVDYCMNKATLQSQHNINITGGTSNIRYFISAGAYTQSGMFKQFDLPYDLTFQYKRFNYRSNLDIDVTKTTTVSFNIAGSVDNQNRPFTSGDSSGIIGTLYKSTPFSSPGFVNGKLVYTATDYSDLTLPHVGTSGMDYVQRGYQTNSNTKLSADLILSQKLDMVTKGLSFKLKGSYNSNFAVRTDGEREIATYTPWVLADGTLDYRKTKEDGRMKITQRKSGKGRNWYMEAGLNYDRAFGKHHVGALVLYNQSKSYYPSTYSDIPSGYVGLVGRVTYDWNTRYMAEFNVGHNGSENFAPGKRFGTFPAGSIGWVVSEENFWESIKPYINYMKFRVSMGLVGNDKVGGDRFMYTSDPYTVDSSDLVGGGKYGHAYNFGISNPSNLLGAFEAAKHNADVTWEKAFKQNYGVDFTILNERLNVSVDYYKEKRRDILLRDYTAPGVLGFVTPMANMGSVDSWGWELSLKWNDRIGDNFRYYVGLNLSNNENKVIEKKEAPLNNDFQYEKGHRIGARKLYQFWRYYDEGTPALYEKTFGTPFPDHGVNLQPGDCVYVDLDKNGVIDANDMTRELGFTDDPKYVAGLNMGFSWKNFDVSLQWTGAWNVSRMVGEGFRMPFKSNQDDITGGLLLYQYENTWTKENPSQDAAYPRATWTSKTNNYADSQLFEANASYLRLKTLQVAYNFHFPFMKKLKMNTCQLMFSGYNLLTITDFKWGDPESRVSGAPTYPLSKTYSLSLKVGF